MSRMPSKVQGFINEYKIQIYGLKTYNLNPYTGVREGLLVEFYVSKGNAFVHNFQKALQEEGLDVQMKEGKYFYDFKIYDK